MAGLIRTWACLLLFFRRVFFFFKIDFYHSTNIWQNFSIEPSRCWDFFVGRFWQRTYSLRRGVSSSSVDDFSLKEVACLSWEFTFIGIKLPAVIANPSYMGGSAGSPLCPSAWRFSLLTTLSQFINFQVVFDFLNYRFQVHWSVFIFNYGDYFACCWYSWKFFL